MLRQRAWATTAMMQQLGQHSSKINVALKICCRANSPDRKEKPGEGCSLALRRTCTG